jgi:hypothetical protein
MQRVSKEVRELQAQTKQKISTVFVQFLRDHSSFAKKRWDIQGEVAGAKVVYAGMIHMASEYALMFKQDHALAKTDPDGLNLGLVMDALNTMLDDGKVTLNELTALMESLDEKQIIAIISRPTGSSVIGGKKDVATRIALECAAGLRELVVPETFKEQLVHLGNLYVGQAQKNMPAVTDAIIQLASTYETFKQLSDIARPMKGTAEGELADKQMKAFHEQALALVETIIFKMDFNSVSTLPASRLQKLRELAVALDSLSFDFNVDQPTMNGKEMKVDSPLAAAIKKAEVLLAARPARLAPRTEANAQGLRDLAPVQAAVQPSTTPARNVEHALTALGKGNGFVVADVVTALKTLNSAAGGKPLAREQIAEMLQRMDRAVLGSLATVLGDSECQYLTRLGNNPVSQAREQEVFVV